MPRIDEMFWTRRISAAATLLLAACAPSSLVEVSIPSTVVDPSTVASVSGATQLYDVVVTNYALKLGGVGNLCEDESYLTSTGVATDELMKPGVNFTDYRDLRGWNGTSSCEMFSYPLWHQPRVQARQAREALQLYAPGTPKAWQGRLYAIEAYTVLMFAEWYCSGIPMTTVSLFGNATPTVGFTTDQMFQYAAALFDTAMTLAADSTRFMLLAKVGKGRALLGLGRLADAAAAVQGVPTGFVYNTEHDNASFSGRNINAIGRDPRRYFAQDHEGGNGLVWSTDPRAAIVTTPALSGAMPYSAKYSVTSAGVMDPTQTIVTNPVRAADGIEARLIEAEADLAAGGSNWLAILNLLRATCIGAAACAPVPGLTAAALPPLADPGSTNARLDLLMQERAMWLFLTGHRFGDLRRMTHVYHRDPNALWPTGIYNNPGFLPRIGASDKNGQNYGTAFVMTLSSTNEQGNPLFTGCFNYDP